jgi:hypothetical protein
MPVSTVTGPPCNPEFSYGWALQLQHPQLLLVWRLANRALSYGRLENAGCWTLDARSTQCRSQGVNASQLLARVTSAWCPM